ncbi:helix-turn-helix transcriptional regulator [Lysinibacillus fusiformis]|uniref:helix-turn-helix domain-containing protein n=1 Tax=Lysinibacillus fusiformis TaxID=28031 RepID=UPI002E249338|nr:helix-turn-helix transcriptional regulator [Lysinibacillus fusiformis]
MEFNNLDSGKILKTIRKHAGLTQEELAQKLFVEQSTISKIENGKSTLYAHFLFECAKVTGTQELVAEMLFGKEVAEKVKELMTTSNLPTQVTDN